MARKVRVLALNSSPRKYGNTFKLLRVAIRAAEFEGGEVELVNLYDYEIEPCIGCVSDLREACRYPCVVEDGGRELIEKVYGSDAVIFATPIYWYGPPGHLKNLIDRLTCLENMAFVEGRSWAEGKVAGLIAAGGDSGNISTIGYLMVVLNSMGFLIPPWALAYYVGEGDPLERQESVSDAANVGALVVRLAKLIRGIEEWYDPKLLDEIGGEKLIESVRREADRVREEELKERLKRIKKLLKGP